MQTGMYAISEMASLFNVSRQTLIYYDKIGLFKPAVVNEKGYRFYSPTQIPLMRLICMLRDLGLELDEIDRLTSTFDIGEMTDHLRSRVQALDEQIAGLRAERASVQERLSFYDERFTGASARASRSSSNSSAATWSLRSFRAI